MFKRSRNLLKISEAAIQAGVLPSTIRYYTDIGLLHAKSETPGGHRLYDKDSTIATIRKIQYLNQQGKTMEDIKNELLLSADKKKILVIDDEPETGNIVMELVKDRFPAFETKVVYDGFNAGITLHQYMPDLVILDLMLPGVNGFDVCRQIRSGQFLSATKILAITGYDSEDNKKQIFECGANDYLAKPMDMSALSEKISSLLHVKPKATIPTL